MHTRMRLFRQGAGTLITAKNHLVLQDKMYSMHFAKFEKPHLEAAILEAARFVKKY